MKQISAQRAGLAGFLYGALMCAWTYYDHGASLDQLAIRFAIYFTLFSVGFYFLYNFIAKRAADRE